MSGWILDTNILSQFAPSAAGPSRASSQLRDWLTAQQDVVFLSVVSIMEITSGIAKLRRTGSTRRVAALDQWLSGIVDHYGERILPIDTPIGMLAGELADQARADGHHPGLSDILIAATARIHEHGLMTENLRHFEPLELGIALLNPLVQAPSVGKD